MRGMRGKKTAAIGQREDGDCKERCRELQLSSSRKEFDVKQILRIRWRWFGHQAAATPHSPPPLRDHLTGSGASDNHGDGPPSSPSARGRGGLVPSGSAGSYLCHGSNNNNRNQPECRSSAAQCWIAPPSNSRPRRRHTGSMEPRAEGSLPRLAPEEVEAGAPLIEENNNNQADTDTSSCRTSNSSATLSSCVSLEPCACPEESLFTAVSHADATFHKMEGYLRSRQLCDVTLVLDNQLPRIAFGVNEALYTSQPFQRLVLSSVSDYFAAMFTSDVREAKQEEVKMEGVDPDALWMLVQYAYTGRLELREDTIESLLSASCLLQLSRVVQACCSFLVRQLHPSNCLGIRSYADAQGCSSLQSAAHSYTMEHFMEVMEGQEFLLLPMEEMARLLTSDDANVPEEETVVTALLTWVRHDAAARETHLPSLLAHIRLPLLQPQV
ncbi:hypothetical protein NHX12_018886 [Muraenolepis orangiensis]|uniref:BTB domain-containing protein n=1 Tax=Muraenolepis orangiensis TaxID=630683 RepID=A0A9Q0F0F9_9TELE|nr:hypothetical protein NHX12_018886 [Muraenolepis orangiensis]